MNDKNEIRQLTQEEFPEQLFETPEPPKKLFVRGAMPSENSVLLTVVGSRKYSAYGKEVCEKLIAGLSGHDVIIVSGLALGIDAIAHKAAIDADIKTIAVPGSGISDNVLYPRTNQPLAKKIIEKGGALLSEFEPDFRATPWSFPQRNRLMAGLSHATLVIEAQERSGTLITARLALDYNRNVLTVPGSIFSHNSTGTNRIMRQGAMPITSSEELLQELGFNIEENKNTQKQLNLGDFSPQERKVLEILHEPVSRDELIRELGFEVSQANTLLSAMEIKGFIKEYGGKMRIS